MARRPLTIQFRAYPDAQSERSPQPRTPINWALIFDTETVTDASQSLLFGFAQLRGIRQDDNGVPDKTVCVREIIFHANDLPKTHPRTYRALRKFVETRGPNVYAEHPDRYDEAHGQVDLMSNETSIDLIDVSSFVKDYILDCGYAGNIAVDSPWYEPATIVGFNLSFDMWRLVTRVIPELRGWHRGGLGGEFLGGPSWTPRYGEFKAGIGMRRWMTKTARLKEGKERKLDPAHMVDVAELVRALTATKSHSLRSAGKAFGCQTLKSAGREVFDPERNYTGDDLDAQIERFIIYARNDVNATAELWFKVSQEFYKHPIQLKPELTFSTASISKQYFREMGIHAPLCGCKKCKRAQRGAHGIPKDVLGRCMAGFFGGRSEVRVRMESLPAVLADFVSMYPSIMILSGIWEMLTAERIECREETVEIQQLLDGLTMEDLWKPETIRQLCGVAEFRAEGNLLPIRTTYADAPDDPDRTASAANIGVNYFTSGESPVTYSLMDLAADKINNDGRGKVPRLIRAWRFYPAGGTQKTLKAVKFYGSDELSFNPAEVNLFQFIVEQRQAAKQRHKENPDQAVDMYGEFDWNVKPISIGSFRHYLHPSGGNGLSHVICGKNGYVCGRCSQLACDHWQMTGDMAALSQDMRKALYEKYVTSGMMADHERQMIEVHACDNTRDDVWNPDPDKCLCAACKQRQFLKIFMNAIYGILAEMNTQKTTDANKCAVYGLDGESWEPANPEQPGEFCFPPFACIVTGGARLLLSMAEHEVREAGSAIVFCDTDSACIPASPDGGQAELSDGQSFRILPYPEVDAIREKFRRLNPYPPGIVRDFLDWQYPERDGSEFPADPVYVSAISAKRYALYRKNPDGTIQIVKRSEHGLGMYINPLASDVNDEGESRKGDWIGQVWNYIIRRHVLAQKVTEPDWFGLPAVSKLPVRTQHVLAAFNDYNGYRDDGEGSLITDTPINRQIIPYNWYLGFHLNRWDQGLRPTMRLIAPYSDNPSEWPDLDLIDVHTGRTHKVTTDQECPDPERIVVKTYRDVIQEYVRHPEVKYDDSDGMVCGEDTRGLLQPTEVISIGYQYITKDATSLTTDDESFTYTGPQIYRDDTGTNAYRAAIEILKERDVTGTALARDTGISPRMAQMYLANASRTPRSAVMESVISYAASLLRGEHNDGKELPALNLDSMTVSQGVSAEVMRRRDPDRSTFSMTDRQVIGMWKHEHDKARQEKREAESA